MPISKMVSFFMLLTHTIAILEINLPSQSLLCFCLHLETQLIQLLEKKAPKKTNPQEE